MNTADKLLRIAQTRYMRHFHACLRCTNEKVLPGNFVFVERTLTDQAHKLAPVATERFPIAALVDTHTITIQRPGGTVE